jgi:hypothetical protein
MMANMNSIPKSEVRSPKAIQMTGLTAWLALALWAVVARAEPQFQFDFKPVVPGVDQAHLEMKTQDGPWSIFVVRVDRLQTNLQIRPALAQESGAALRGLSSIMNRFRLKGWQPVAGINANLFAKDTGGFVAGLHLVDGEVCSTPNWPHTFTAWADHAGHMFISPITNGFSLTWPDGHTTPLRLNAAPDTNSPVIFAGAARCILPRDAGPTFVLQLENTTAPLLPANATRRARVVANGAASSTVAQQVILVPGPSFREQAQAVKPGEVFTISTRMSHDLSGAVWAVSGVPHLISGGKLHSYFSQPPEPGKPTERHPRSLLGFNDHFLFLVVVDGRQPKLSIGMDYAELCRLMQQLGCIEALSLDGGGSTALWLNGRVVSSPSNRFGWERPVANVLMVLRRKE